MSEVTVAEMTAIYEAVHEHVTCIDEPTNFNNTLEEMFESYIIHGFDGTTEEYRDIVLYHYKNLHGLIKALGEIL